VSIKSLSVSTTLILATLGCGGSDSGTPRQETISEDAFVEAYFQLRLNSLRDGPGETIDLDVRDSILGELGVTPDELLTFVDVWGKNGEVMEDVWARIDSLVRQARVEASDDDYEEEEVMPDTGTASGSGRGSG
jgi:hypothetical protein